MKLFSFLITLVIGACCLPPNEVLLVGTDVVQWEGSYSYSLVHGSIGLDLREDGSFSLVSNERMSAPELKDGKWFESPSMVYLEPDGSWGIAEPFRFLQKVILDGDRFLLPSGHNEFMYDQAGYLLELSFFGGSEDRYHYHWDKQSLSGLIDQGMSLEGLLEECGTTMDELEEMGLLPRVQSVR